MATKDSRFVANYKGYLSVYESFAHHRREKEKSWVENDVIPRLTNLFGQENPTTKPEFKILAVGSGVGTFDVLLIKALFSYGKELMEGKQVIYTVVEPNAAAIDEFKQSVSLQDGIFRNVKFTWLCTDVQEFIEAKEPEEYDFIHFLHVLYYVDNEENVLKSAYKKFLASPGCILVVTGAEGDIWTPLIELFKTKIPSLSSEFRYLSNIELSKVCKRNGWIHEAMNKKVDFEITEIFNEENPKGKALLKFFFHTNEEPKELLGSELFSEIMDFFRRMSWDSKKGGEKYVYVNEDEGICLIYKTI